jgi:antitoxin ParD1/3/4
MDFSLPPDLVCLVRRKVEVRLYPSPDAVIREALLLLDERDRLREERLHDLKRELAIGISQASGGQIAHFDEEALAKLMGGASFAPCPLHSRLMLPSGLFVTVRAWQDLQVADADLRGPGFPTEVLDAFLSHNRESGKDVCLGHLFPDLRSFAVSPYNIYYLAAPNRPVVIRVLHLAWDIGNIVNRITMTDKG